MLEDKYLKDKFTQIQPIYKAVDLEDSIMKKIERQANYKMQIARYKRLGRISLIVSLSIFAIYGLSFLLDESSTSGEKLNHQLGLILLSFILIITQLESSNRLKKINL